MIAYILMTYELFLYYAGVKVSKDTNLGLNDLNQLQMSSTLYLGGYQYNNSILQFFPHSQGYVKHNINPNNNTSVYDYVYQYKDHLGNIRINYTFDLATSSLKVLEETDVGGSSNTANK